VEDPEAVRQQHREFLRAGADVMQAFTYASEDKLTNRSNKAGATIGVEKINREALHRRLLRLRALPHQGRGRGAGPGAGHQGRRERDAGPPRRSRCCAVQYSAFRQATLLFNNWPSRSRIF
jgi:hypothetical protein